MKEKKDRTFRESLFFQYQMQEDDTDTDRIGISANSLKLNGGAIYDKAGNAAGLSHNAVAADSSQKVDTSNQSQQALNRER